MVKKIHIGLGVLLLAVPLLIAACGDDDNVVTAGPGAAPAAATWVVPDNTFSDNIVTIFGAAPDNLYYNVRSAAHSGGEIRGQLDASGAVRMASLNNTQVIGTGQIVATGAFGAGVLVVDNVTNEVRGFIRTSGMTGTGATLHLASRETPAIAANALLTLTGGPDLWVIPDNTIADNVAAAFNAQPDNLVLNVTSAAHPLGEIRGQLDAEGLVRVATLDGAQDNVTTAARGAGMLIVDNSALAGSDNSVRGFIVSSGLAGTAAHVHNAARGTAGPIVLPLFGGPTLWIVADGQVFQDNLVAIFNAAPDNLYFNVHTAANPGGEIRGQLDASGEILFATLNGAQETPSVATSAFGGGILSVDTLTSRVGGFLMSSGVTGTAAHVHNAARGVPGPIILPLLPAP
jgi:hypothetical protein